MALKCTSWERVRDVAYDEDASDDEKGSAPRLGVEIYISAPGGNYRQRPARPTRRAAKWLFTIRQQPRALLDATFICNNLVGT
jgi:hypothetical protein